MPEDEGERKSNNPKGRPRLDLTPEQRIERHRLIRKYHAQINYYIHGNKLDLTKPQMITEVTIQDVRRASRFRKNIKEIFEGLQQLGGIPRSLQPLAESLEDESLPDKTERAERRDRLQAPVEVDP